jgi:hypothetical protein
MTHDRMVIAYHGCDERVAERLLAGEPFRKSSNDFDWLGEGVYFWEYGLDRALQFAREQQARGKVERPAVVGALLRLGNCFDLMDTRFTAELSDIFPEFRANYDERGWSMPNNGGADPDRLLRRLDCAVLNFYFNALSTLGGTPYDSVRCGFAEGTPVFAGSRIFTKSHVQIAIREQSCLVGTFRPPRLRSGSGDISRRALARRISPGPSYS